MRELHKHDPRVFLVGTAYYTLVEMMLANVHDEALMAWLQDAKHGDVWNDGERVECIADGTPADSAIDMAMHEDKLRNGHEARRVQAGMRIEANERRMKGLPW
jgi:hypothetical protein